MPFIIGAGGAKGRGSAKKGHPIRRPNDRYPCKRGLFAGNVLSLFASLLAEALAAVPLDEEVEGDPDGRGGLEAEEDDDPGLEGAPGLHVLPHVEDVVVDVA